MNKQSQNSGQLVGIPSVGWSWLQNTGLSGTRQSGHLQTSAFCCWKGTGVHHGATFHEHELVKEGGGIVPNVGHAEGVIGTSSQVIVDPSVVSVTSVTGHVGVAPGGTEISTRVLVRVAIKTVVNVVEPEVTTVENVVVIDVGTEGTELLGAAWLSDGAGLGAAGVAEALDEEGDAEVLNVDPDDNDNDAAELELADGEEAFEAEPELTDGKEAIDTELEAA